MPFDAFSRNASKSIPASVRPNVIGAMVAFISHEGVSTGSATLGAETKATSRRPKTFYHTKNLS
jgi:hypothetical protein